MSPMTNLRPYRKLAITRVSDGEGGWTYTENSTEVVYLNVEFHDNTMMAVCRFNTDLTVKDLVRLEDGVYEVTKVVRQTGSMKLLTLVRQDKPIEPVEEESS
jgi:hypothetical protein